MTDGPYTSGRFGALLYTAMLDGLVGFAFAAAPMAPEFVDRLRWSWNGGGGERADWGEPLFYMVILGVPLGFVVAAAGAILAGLALWATRKK